MAQSHELAFYSITIRNKNTRRDITTNSFDLDGNDLFNVLFDYFTRRKKTVLKNESDKVLLNVGRLDANNKTRLVKGIIHTGAYGREGLLVDSETGEGTEITKNHADVRPFYFLLSLPSDKAQGIIAFERYNGLGVKDVVQADLRNHFNKLTDNAINITLDVLSYEALLEQLKLGKLKEIRIVKYALPTDYRAAFLNQKQKPEETTMEMLLKPVKGKEMKFGFKDIIKYIENFMGSAQPIPLDKVLEIKGVEYDTIKAQFEINGKTKTVNLANPLATVSYFDISEEVEVSNGRTTFHSIDSIAEKYIEEFEKKLDNDTTNGEN